MISVKRHQELVVELSEARAEIERLEKEVARWKDIAEATEALKQQYALLRDNSWNDAIEPAYEAAEVYSEEYRMNEYDEGFVHGSVAARDSILALKRSQE